MPRATHLPESRGHPVTWKLPVDVVSKTFQEVVKVAQKPENAVQLVIGLGFHSSAWRTLNTMRCGGLC